MPRIRWTQWKTAENTTTQGLLDNNEHTSTLPGQVTGITSQLTVWKVEQVTFSLNFNNLL